MLKVKNENIRTISMALFSTFSIVYLEQVNVSWVNTRDFFAGAPGEVS